MTKSVGVHEAKTHLSRLIADANAGDEIVITSRGVPVARLIAAPPSERTFGTDRGALEVPEDFNAPLPDELLDAFGA